MSYAEIQRRAYCNTSLLSGRLRGHYIFVIFEKELEGGKNLLLYVQSGRPVSAALVNKRQSVPYIQWAKNLPVDIVSVGTSTLLINVMRTKLSGQRYSV